VTGAAVESLLESRAVLAPHLGAPLRFRGVAMRDGYRRDPTTLVCRLDAWLRGGWVRAADHTWVQGGSLCRHWGRGVLLEFTATVRHYAAADPTTGAVADRYSVDDPRDVVPLGPADLINAIAELVGVWGWERVADAVERAHGGQ
jgi:hypothetical protein